MHPQKKENKLENEIVKYEDISKEIDRIRSSLPLIPAASFMRAFGLADAVSKMEEIFDHPQVRKTVLAMQDKPFGFLTDRAVKGEPYGYDIVKQSVIQALIDGYLITGNEFNIIMNRYMPVKAGKFRLINEHPGLSNFNPTTTSATYFFEERGGWNNKKEMMEVAKVQCYATWNLDGKKCSIGYDDDKLVFKIKVNKGMGDDGIVGKALSKLYGRVLTRLIGISIPEVDDIDGIVSEDDVPANLKSANPEPAPDDFPAKNPIVNKPEDEKPAPEPDPKKAPFVPPCVCGNTQCKDGYDILVRSHCDDAACHGTGPWLFPDDSPKKRCENFKQLGGPEYKTISNKLEFQRLEKAKSTSGIHTPKNAEQRWALYEEYYRLLDEEMKT